MSSAPSLTPSGEVAVRRSGYVRAVRSEWIKTRSLRSTWILVFFALAAFIGLARLAVGSGEAPSSLAAVQALWTGTDFALILIAILATLTITSEFTTGMARNTFTATPTRGAVLGAKATVASLLALVITVVGIVGAWAVTAPVMSGASIDFGDTDTVRYVAVQLLYVVVIAIFAVGLGALMRSAVGTIFTILAIELIAPPILISVNNAIANWFGAILPSSAASAASAALDVAGEISSDVTHLNTTMGLVVLLLWAIVPMVFARITLGTRDI